MGSIGLGGMGEVYRAHDPHLGRDVAAKIISASFATDASRVRRFEQEARSAAALNHPNILTVYDVGLQDGSPYIVSELLEGESLRERLRFGPLPVRKAIDYAQQIARGLAAAHDKGIAHRDLKPENIFIMRDGRVKILDFGLAKLTRTETSAQDVTGTLQSDAGTVVGTVGYMSPEQIRGRVTDVRTDLFAFGAILYEMFSGQRAFQEDTVADTMTAILTKDPPGLTEARADVPPALERIVRHCLEKSVEERFQSARDVAFDLDTMTSASVVVPVTASMTATRRRRFWWIAAAAATALTLLAVGLFAGRKSAPIAGVPSYQQLTFRRGTIGTAKFAPDGQVIYSAAWEGNRPELFTTSTEARGATPTGIRDADIESISRFGELLLVSERHQVHAFVRPGTLSRAPLSGSAPRPILEDVQDADWAPDGNSIAVARYGDQRFRLEFPVGKVLYDTGGWISCPRVSPKGDMVAFLEHPLFGDDRGTVAVVNLAGQKRTLSPEYASTQALAWSPHGDELWFSAATTGAAADLYAVNLQGKVRTVTRVPGGLRLLDINSDGRVIMEQGHVRRAAMVLGQGQTSERDLAVADWSLNRDLTPDGSMLLLEEEAEGAEGGQYSVYLRKTDGSQPVRLGTGEALRLSHDGKWAVGATLSSPRQLILLPTGAGEARPLTHDAIDHLDADWLPDNKHIVFSGTEPGHKPRVYIQGIEDGAPRPIGGEGVTDSIDCSPDGQLVAVKQEQRVVILPLDGSPPRAVPGLGNDDHVARWSADGKALYVVRAFDIPAKLYRVDIASGKRDLVKQFTPADPAGVEGIGPIQITPDLRYYSYGFGRYLTDMYVVLNLK
jgi:Tol biopolymer transport system component